MPQPAQQTESSPVISGTSILIFSGFLIGVTVGWGVGGELSPYVLSCGLAGMLAFVGIELARTRRRERELIQERRLIVSRLQRHVSRSQMGDSHELLLPEPVNESRSDPRAETGTPQLAD